MNVNKGYVLGHTRARSRVRGGPSGSEFVLASFLACLAWLPTPAHSTHSPKHERTYVCTISELAPSKFTTRPENAGERPSLYVPLLRSAFFPSVLSVLYVCMSVSCATPQCCRRNAATPPPRRHHCENFFSS